MVKTISLNGPWRKAATTSWGWFKKQTELLKLIMSCRVRLQWPGTVRAQVNTNSMLINKLTFSCDQFRTPRMKNNWRTLQVCLILRRQVIKCIQARKSWVKWEQWIRCKIWTLMDHQPNRLWSTAWNLCARAQTDSIRLTLTLRSKAHQDTKIYLKWQTDS